MSWDGFADWDGTPRGAIALQKALRKRIRLVPLEKEPRLVGGADVSMDRFATKGFAGFVTLGYRDLQKRAESVARERIEFPYIPGLLSFREIPMLLGAWEALTEKPDVILVDGVGIAHPRRLGIATHLGIALGLPTVGVAKSVLVGSYEEPDIEAGSISWLYHGSETVGAALRTKRLVKPVFVSPGHLITLEESVELVKRCVQGYRLPEPTRIAHETVNEYRRADKEKEARISGPRV